MYDLLVFSLHFYRPYPQSAFFLHSNSIVDDNSMAGELILPFHGPSVEQSRQNSLREPLAKSAGNNFKRRLAPKGILNDHKVNVPQYMESLPSSDKKLACPGRDQPCANCELGNGADCLYQHTGFNYDWIQSGGYDIQQPPHQQQFKPLLSQSLQRRETRRRKSRNPIVESVCFPHAFRMRLFQVQYRKKLRN